MTLTETAIERVIAAARAVDPPPDCADLHTDLGDGIVLVPLDHWGAAGCCSETCQACGGLVRVMTFRGTGFCSQRCQEAPT